MTGDSEFPIRVLLFIKIVPFDFSFSNSLLATYQRKGTVQSGGPNILCKAQFHIDLNSPYVKASYINHVQCESPY